MLQDLPSVPRPVLMRLAVILTALLVALVSIALLAIVIQVLQRIGNVLVLFTLGAIVAYVVNPAVNWAARVFGKRWAGMVAVYGGVLVGLVVIALLLFQPLLTESSSLVSSLNSPSAASLQILGRITHEANGIEAAVRQQQRNDSAGRAIPSGDIRQIRSNIAGLQQEIAALQSGPAGSAAPGAQGRNATPVPQLRIPPTYVAPLRTRAAALATDYESATGRQTALSRRLLGRAIADAAAVEAATVTARHTVSTTPILFLDAQTWADQHHIAVNVQKSAGQVVKKATGQAASILNNTANILTTTGTLLLNTMLILLISLYFVSDGAEMIQRGLGLVPSRFSRQAKFFVQSVDTVLGESIRASLALAALAGVLGGVGAAALGVPYAVLIAVSTFVLELVPVIGPVILVIPPAVIALFFTTPTRAAILLIWFIVFQQIVTNVLGPRLTSKKVGINPLEAMAAALVGYPIAGILGSFLAVPTVGLIHVLVRQAYSSWNARGLTPIASGENTGETGRDGSQTARHGVGEQLLPVPPSQSTVSTSARATTSRTEDGPSSRISQE